jgi:L-rhamnose mutarotase
MNKIHTFGDSFTFGHGCVENCSFKEYYKYKKEDDDIWPNLLSKKIEMNVSNYGKNAFCNEQIFDSIIKNFDLIKENDIVIIEKTYHNRLSVPNNSEWISALSIDYTIEETWRNKLEKVFSKEETETLINFQYYFSPKKLYEKRNNDRFDFLKKILVNNTKVKDCIIWDMPKIYDSFESVKTATNGEFIDFHFSFKGHKQFAEYMENIINKKIL